MTTPIANVSTINVAPLFGNDMAAKMEVAEEIDKACRDTGFFFVSNHSIDVHEFAAITRKFHMAVTDEERWKLAIAAYNPSNAKHIRNGFYLPIEGKKAVQSYCILNPSFTEDHPMIKSNTPLHEVNVWPDEEKHPGFREYQENYYRKVFNLSLVLLRGFALALGKEEKFFDEYFTKNDTLSSMSLIRYPYLDDYPPVKTAEDGTKLSFEWHEDISLITVLYQSQVQNLQVKTDEGWLDIPASDECYLVNAGSYMPYITNGYYKAPIHRVKFVNAERLSLPFFVNLGYNSRIVPFTPHQPEISQHDDVMTYGQYLQHGLKALIVKNGQT